MLINVIGASNTPYTAPYFSDLSTIEETKRCVDYIAETAQGAEIVGIGLSIGANRMLKLAGDDEKCPLQSMVSVSNPFDLTMVINLMRDTPHEVAFIRKVIKTFVLPEHRTVA